MTYIVNMPAELFIDGYLFYRRAKVEKYKLEKDRYLRSGVFETIHSFTVITEWIDKAEKV